MNRRRGDGGTNELIDRLQNGAAKTEEPGGDSRGKIAGKHSANGCGP